MIESSRRHGHFDPRWHTNSSRPPRPLVPAAEDGDPSIQNWENEGGRYATTDQTGAPAGLGWYAFFSRYFPGRRRHDLEALKAYETYRSAAAAPQSALRRRSHAVTRRPAHPSLERSRLLERDAPRQGEKGDTLGSAFWPRILARQASAARRVRL